MVVGWSFSKGLGIGDSGTGLKARENREIKQRQMTGQEWLMPCSTCQQRDSSSLATRPTPNLSRPQHHPHHQLSHHLNHHHHHQRSSLSSPHSSLSSCMQTNHTQAFDAFKTHTHRWIYTTFTYRRLDKYRTEEFSKSDAAGDVAGVPF